MTGKQDKETGRCARDEDRTWRKARARKGSFDEGARGERREPARGAAQREKQEDVQETSEVGDTGVLVQRAGHGDRPSQAELIGRYYP